MGTVCETSAGVMRSKGLALPKIRDDNAVYHLADGATARLGAVLAKAGEGIVYAVDGQPDSVAKIFYSSSTGWM